jgi:Tfp pilus assembly PilM family ATPase
MFNFFRKTAIGIDISDHAINIARLEGGENVHVLSVGKAVLEAGVVEKGRIKDTNKLSSAFRRARDEANIDDTSLHDAVFGLPESQVFTHLYEPESTYTQLSEIERNSVIQKEVARSIPINSDDVVYSSSIIFSDTEKTKILIVAASKTVLAEWHNFFISEGVNVVAYDSEILALFRNLRDARVTYPVGVVDIGKNTSNIAIFDSYGICLSYSVPIAGDFLTGEIASSFKIKTDSDSENLFAIVKALEPLAKEIQSARVQCQRRIGEDVAKIILVGGSSKLPKLKEYLEANLSLPVNIGGPELSMDGGESDIDYIEAVGLGLRGVDPDRYTKEPALVFSQKKKWYAGLSNIISQK